MTDQPGNLTVHPESGRGGAAAGDLLSHALSQIRLTGDHVYSCSVAAGEHLERLVGAGHICVITEGAMTIAGDGHERFAVETGDLVLLTAAADNLRLVTSGSPATAVVCRFWIGPDSLQGMTFALPRCIHIKRTESAKWLDGLVRYMLLEAEDTQPGASLMISRLIDLRVRSSDGSAVYRTLASPAR